MTYLTKLDLAVRVCDLPYSVAKYAVISDDGHTLTMDGSIASGYDEGLSDADEACIFNKLEMPDRVRQEINGTRPADGRVRASWGEFDASWTFSVTKGLNLIISDGKL